MTALTDYAKNLLARALTGRQPALPAAVYVGLGTGGNAAAGLTGEAVGNGYVRQAVNFTGTGPQGNAAPVKFTFTAAPGTLSHLGLFDAVSGGNPLGFAPLGAPATLSAPGTITIPPASLTIVPE